MGCNHRRYLEGKTKTHTRAIYTDSEYRKAVVQSYAKNEGWEEDSDKILATLRNATKAYAYASQDLLEAAALPALFLIFWSALLIFFTSKHILSEK